MSISNLKVNEKENQVLLSVNPKVYPLDVVYSAAYVFLGRAYVLLDGNPKKEILVKLKPKKKGDLEKMGGEFFNELINYADYRERAKQTKKIREMIMQRVLITHDSSVLTKEDEFDGILDEVDDEEFDDPEGIAIPWEEKYGDKAKEGKNEDKTK